MRLKVIISKWKTWWNHFDYAHSHGFKQLEFLLWKSMTDSKCWWKGIYRSSAAEKRSECLNVNCFSRLFAELNRPIDLFENFTKKNKFKSENKRDLQSTANILSWRVDWTLVEALFSHIKVDFMNVPYLINGVSMAGAHWCKFSIRDWECSQFLGMKRKCLICINAWVISPSRK